MLRSMTHPARICEHLRTDYTAIADIPDELLDQALEASKRRVASAKAAYKTSDRTNKRKSLNWWKFGCIFFGIYTALTLVQAI